MSKVSPFSVLVVFCALTLIGLFIYPFLNIQILPSQRFSVVTIVCSTRMSSPENIESEVTSLLEGHLTTLSGIRKISSISGSGECRITLDLASQVEVNMFRLELASLLRKIYPKLPVGTSFPVVSSSGWQNAGPDASPLIAYTLTGPGTSAETAELAEKLFSNPLNQLNGISRVDITGVEKNVVSIVEDPFLMEAASISHEDLSGLLQVNLAEYSLGILNTQSGNSQVKIGRSIVNLEDLNDIPIRNAQGTLYRLKEISKIKIQKEAVSSYFRINGADAISISIIPDKNVNVVQLSQQIRSLFLRAEKSLPAGVKLILQYDNSHLIKDELFSVILRTALSITILLIFVFFVSRKFSHIFVILSSLIVNVSLSFILYYVFDLEIHIYSLAGISVSIGLIIDNAIIIIDDIQDTGHNRIFAAILASTITSLSTLSVIFFLDKAEQVNIIDFAYAIIITLLISLPVAYYFIPAMLGQLQIKQRVTIMKPSRLRFQSKLKRRYAAFLGVLLRYRSISFCIVILVFGIPAFLLPMKLDGDGRLAHVYNSVFGSDFYNNELRTYVNRFFGGSLYLFYGNQNTIDNAHVDEDLPTRLRVDVTMPFGTQLQQINVICQDFERFLKAYPNHIAVVESRVSNNMHASIIVTFQDGVDEDFPIQLKQALETKAISSGAADFDIYGLGKGFSNVITLEQYDSTIKIKGYNFNALQNIALKIKDIIGANPRARNILITTAERSQGGSHNQYFLRLAGPAHLRLYHILNDDIERSLHQQQSNTANVGEVLTGHGRKVLPVELTSNNGDYAKIWDLMNFLQNSKDSTRFKLQNFATIDKVRVGESITKQDQSFLLNIHYQFIGSQELNYLVKSEFLSSVKKMLPTGYSVLEDEYLGNDNNAKISNYLWMIPLVILLIYMICCILLESVTQPLTVIMMIPFSYIGVFMMFSICGLKISQGAYAAFLLIAGLTTNSAIYIVNDVNYLRKLRRFKEAPLRTLYLKATISKGKPISISTASAILSLLPFMVIGSDTGFWYTIAAGTIGGLVFSFLGVFFFMPLLLKKSITG